MMDNKEMKQYPNYEEYRKFTYKALAECYHLPDFGLLKLLSSIDKTNLNILSDCAINAPLDADIEALTVEYSRLFVGPYRLLSPPYGSVYLEDKRTVMGNSTMDIKQKYADEGLFLNLKEAPDHIAIELEFMYFLVSKGIDAVIDGEYEKALSYLEKQEMFLTIHLGAWITEFTDSILSASQNSFYRTLASTTNSFVLEDLYRLSHYSIADKNRIGSAGKILKF